MIKNGSKKIFILVCNMKTYAEICESYIRNIITQTYIYLTKETSDEKINSEVKKIYEHLKKNKFL